MSSKDLNPWDEIDRVRITKMVQRKLERAQNPPKPERVQVHKGQRLPPGQELTDKWPVLDLGQQPLIDKRDWSLSIEGAVEHPFKLDWQAYCHLPRIKTVSDIHCVTYWSRYNNHWDGVSVQSLVKSARPKPEAKFVFLRSYDGYTTNLPLADFLHQDALLADHWEGEPLTREHGGPVRFVLPHLYFWKSAKWLRQIIFRENDHPGFWEVRGYHNYGDPWRQQRFK